MVGSAGLKEDIFPSSSTAVTSAVRSSGGVTGGEHTHSAGKHNTNTIQNTHQEIEERKNMIITKNTKTGGEHTHPAQTHNKSLKLFR